MALLDEAIDGGHRVLVFSQFVDLLSLPGAAVSSSGSGTTAIWMAAARPSPSGVHPAFSPRAVPLFLISLKAGARAST
jgi:hypothetical protein